MPRLRHLDISNCGVLDSDISNLKLLKNLKTLNISTNTKISSSSSRHFLKLRQLEALNIKETSIDSSSFAYFSQLQSFKYLSVGGNLLRYMQNAHRISSHKSTEIAKLPFDFGESWDYPIGTHAESFLSNLQHQDQKELIESKVNMLIKDGAIELQVFENTMPDSNRKKRMRAESKPHISTIENTKNKLTEDITNENMNKILVEANESSMDLDNLQLAKIHESTSQIPSSSSNDLPSPLPLDMIHNINEKTNSESSLIDKSPNEVEPEYPEPPPKKKRLITDFFTGLSNTTSTSTNSPREPNNPVMSRASRTKAKATRNKPISKTKK